MGRSTDIFNAAVIHPANENVPAIGSSALCESRAAETSNMWAAANKAIRVLEKSKLPAPVLRSNEALKLSDSSFRPNLARPLRHTSAIQTITAQSGDEL